MDIGAVMQEIADQLDTIAGLRVFGYPLDGMPPVPAAIVTYPDGYTYDATYGRGMDRITDLEVHLVVGRVWDRTTRDTVSVYVDGNGDSSVKQVIESGNYTEFDSVRVASARFDYLVYSGNEMLAAIFTLDIAGQGEV